MKGNTAAIYGPTTTKKPQLTPKQKLVKQILHILPPNFFTQDFAGKMADEIIRRSTKNGKLNQDLLPEKLQLTIKFAIEYKILEIFSIPQDEYNSNKNGIKKAIDALVDGIIKKSTENGKVNRDLLQENLKMIEALQGPSQEVLKLAIAYKILKIFSVPQDEYNSNKNGIKKAIDALVDGIIKKSTKNGNVNRDLLQENLKMIEALQGPSQEVVRNLALKLAIEDKILEIFSVPQDEYNSNKNGIKKAIDALVDGIIKKSTENGKVNRDLLQENFNNAMVLVIERYSNTHSRNFKDSLEALLKVRSNYDANTISVSKLSSPCILAAKRIEQSTPSINASTQIQTLESTIGAPLQDMQTAQGPRSQLKYLIQCVLTPFAYIADLVANYRNSHRTSSLMDSLWEVERQPISLMKAKGINTDIESALDLLSIFQSTQQQDAVVLQKSSITYHTNASGKKAQSAVSHQTTLKQATHTMIDALSLTEKVAPSNTSTNTQAQAPYSDQEKTTSTAREHVPPTTAHTK